MQSREVQEQVASYIRQEALFPKGSPLLLACSGGSDSVAALDILTKLGYPVAVAHVNYKLRAAESNADEAFVRELASEYHVVCHVTSFNTEAEADRLGTGIQETARKLRYDWMETLRKEHGYHFVVTAHQKEDNAETLLLNLIKRPGIKGIRGIIPKRGKIVRPLLALEKATLKEYLKEGGLSYREDSTNVSLKYDRNKVRHELLPLLKQLNPKVIDALDMMSSHGRDADMLIQEQIGIVRRRVTKWEDDILEIKFNFIRKHPAGRTILFEILHPFGFNRIQSESVFNGLKEQSGKEYLSESHRLIRDRNSLFVQPRKSERQKIRQYEKLPDQIVFNNYKIQVRSVPVEKVNMKQNDSYAYLDLDKLDGSLVIRYWKEGDYFYPFGMTRDRSEKPGKKKLSKYFKDTKTPLHQKDRIPVLFSGQHLIWLVGHRIDHRFRVTDETKMVLKMKVIQS